MALSTIPTRALTEQGINFRNLIINGDMSIAQRGTSGTGFGPSKTGYQLDRFAFRKSGGDSAVFTISQDTDVPSGQGFANSMKIDCTTALADGSIPSSQWVRIRYRIEGQDLQKIKKGTSSAESLTLSFWVKSPKTGTHIVSIYDDDNVRLIAKSYTVSSANTWEKKTIVFEGDTTGTLDNDNNSSFRVEWHLQSGADYQSGSLGTTWHSFDSTKTSVGQVNIGDNTANNFFLTGVQLEVGTSASDFEFLPVDVNLQRCQRYFESSCAPLQNPSDGVDSVYIIDQAGGSHPIYHHMAFNTSKRAVSTLTFYNGNDGSTGTWRTNANTNVSVNTVIIKVQGFGINSNDLGAEGRSSYGSWEADAEL